MEEKSQTKEVLSFEEENKILKIRLNLLALIMNEFLDTDQKSKIFNLLQSIEKIDDENPLSMFTGNTNIYLSTIPHILTEKEMPNKK